MSTYIVDKNTPGKVVVVINSGPQGPIGGTSPPGSPNYSIQYNNDGLFGGSRIIYNDTTGEVRAEKDIHQTVTSTDGTQQVCVWSRFQFPADAVYPTSEVLSIGALDDSDPGWDDSKPGGIDFYAKTWFLFQTGVAADADWAGLLGFQKIAGSTMTGTGWMAYPNFIVSGTFGPEYVDKTQRFGDGAGVLCLENAATEPTTDPTGNSIFWTKPSNHRPYFRFQTGGAAFPIVGDSTTDTLTNKTFNVSDNTLTATGASNGDTLLYNSGTGKFAPGAIPASAPSGTGIAAVTSGAWDTTIVYSTNGYALFSTGTGAAFRSVTAADIAGIPGSSGDILINSGGAIGASSTLAASKIASLPGSDTYVFFNDAGAWGANSGLTFNKTTGLLTVTSTIQATKLRYSSTKTYLDTDGSQMFLCVDSSYTNGFDTVRFYTNSTAGTIYIGLGAQNCITVSSSTTIVKSRAASYGMTFGSANTSNGMPIIGDTTATASAIYGVHGDASISLASADKTLTVNDLSRKLLKFTGTLGGANRTVTLPAPSSGYGYTKSVWLDIAEDYGITVTTGTGKTVFLQKGSGLVGTRIYRAVVEVTTDGVVAVGAVTSDMLSTMSNT